MKKDELKKSSEKVGQILPVLRDGNGNIIDGFHRKAADINWEEVILEWVTTEGQSLMVQIASNWIRRSFKREEKVRILTRLCEIFKDEWEGHYSSNLADITGLNIDTIEKYLPPEYKQQKTRNAPPFQTGTPTPFKMQVNLKYHRDMLKANQPMLSKKVPTTSEHLSEYPKHYENVWVAEPDRPKGFGDSSFHGNTPPDLIREVLAWYTNKGDLVVDNMAGSGTVMDMCVIMGRECDAYDNVPMRGDISKGDARSLPYMDNSVDLVFSHFPYHDMVDYGGDENNLSKMSTKKFLQESRKVMQEAYRILKPHNYYAVLIGDQRKDKEVIDWSAEFSRMGKM